MLRDRGNIDGKAGKKRVGKQTRKLLQFMPPADRLSRRQQQQHPIHRTLSFFDHDGACRNGDWPYVTPWPELTDGQVVGETH